MSALNDNKAFLSGVLNGTSLNFDSSVFGIWVSPFQNVNFSDNGYSYFQPLIRDITAVDFAITGKRFSLFNFDGKYPDVKFIISSGAKGANEYDSTVAVADISDSFVSGFKPLVIMPSVDFTGSVYRRTEITGYRKAVVGNYQTLGLSGEDWQKTSVPVNVGDGTIEYAYFDTGYSGYANEVATRYKFLYDDASHSQRQNISTFEIPIQFEEGTNFKYKISRKSDPIGEFYTPDITTDGKIIIDYSKYKDEVSKPVEAGLNYNFTTVSRFSFPKGVFEDLDDNQVVVRPINDASITGLKLSKVIENDKSYYDFYLSSTGNYDGIYKLTFNIDRYNSKDKTDVIGYVMTGIKTGDASTDVIVNLGVNSGVYPRVVETQKYQSSQILSLANMDELIINEEAAQDLASDVNYEDEDNLAKNIQENVKKNIDLLNDLLKDEPQTSQTSSLDAVDRRDIDDLEKSILDSENTTQIIEKVALPKFILPKDTVPKDYYTNYANSGEQYIAVPLSNYTSPLNYVFYGDQYGQLGYYVEETETSAYRLVVNSTSNGVYVSNTSVCKGDTAIYANMPYSEDVYFENGLCTSIPENGVITKNNYATQNSWKNSVNYFYVKNYLYSVDLFPANSEQDINQSIKNVISNAMGAIGTCEGDFKNENAQAKPILYLEREIYVKPYDKNQIALLNNTLNSGSFTSPSGELTDQQEEKLYCVQTFDTEFAKENNSFFKPSNDYQESLTFKSFAPYKNSNGDTVVNYGVGVNSAGDDFATIYYNDKNKSAEDVYRLEYVTGQAFSYNGTSNFRSWNGTVGQKIEITNQDEKNYGYHLYGYNSATDTLTFIKSNVLNDEISIGLGALTNVVVLKFNKQGFTNNNYSFASADGIVYTAINTSILDNAGSLMSSDNVFFNLQKYSYRARVVTENNFWYTNKELPINDDAYGAEDQFGLFAPRFFEDASEEAISAAEQLFVFPNGPSTSKNYEGSPLVWDNLSSFSQGIFNNKLIITEETKNYSTIDNDFVLNFISRGRITKEEGISNVENYNESRRLKITRVKYNVYSKNLLIVGDAGFPYALALNTGWEYKLQYKKKSESTWKEMESTSTFTKDEIRNISSFLNPYFYKSEDLITPNYLPMVGFLTNISTFLDDSQYEFRIFKYEKFDSASDSVDIIRKTNFLPIQVNWTNDGKSSYFNVYQLDSGNNLKLIKTETQQGSSTFAIPSVKQQYFDLGLTNFSVNGTGYYDIIVSGALPSTQLTSTVANSTFIGDPVIGNSSADPASDNPSGPISINVIQQTSNTSGYNSINGVSYSPLINFNNPESKDADFNIDANYNGYYFVSNGKNATLNSSIYNGFECYVANTGSNANIYAAGSTYALNTNKVAKVISPSITTTDSINSSPSPEVEVSSYGSYYIYVTESFNYNTGDFPAIGELKSSTSTIVNGSNSSIVLTYGTTPHTIPANTTHKLSFNNGWDGSSFTPVVNTAHSYANVDAQTSYISSSEGLVNLNYDSLILKTQNYSELPIYNFAKNELSINGLVNLDSNSFYLVNGNPSTTITAVKKDSFDSIKIYIDGKEEGDGNIFVFKDDTDIDISYFSQDITIDAQRQYYFIKDDRVKRSLNIKIKNGSEEYLIPKGSQDFRLTVSKAVKNNNSEITYEILFPSSDFSTLVSSQMEQLIVIKSQNSHIIDLGYVEASLKSNAFVYFVNSSNENVDFQRNFKSVMTLSQGEIAKITLEKYNSTARITKIKEAKNHFEFEIDPLIHLSEPSGINILNLKFCDTEIKFPSVSEFEGKETFIISKNRLAGNKADYNKIEASSLNAISTDGIFSINSVVSKIYKNASSSIYPTVDKVEIAANDAFSEKNTPARNFYKVFYIKDQDLNSFSIKDYFQRSEYYYGKVLVESSKDFSIYSYDENNISIENTAKKGNSFDFDFDLGEIIDGSLTTKNIENDCQIINSKTEDDGIQIIDDLFPNQYCVNFAYQNVTITNQSSVLIKNRIASINQDGAIKLSPIYNQNEFSIAGNIDSSKRQVYTNYNPENGILLYTSFFYQVNYSTDVESILIPYADDKTIDKKYIIENLSSRSLPIKTLASDSIILTINPNEKKTISYDSNSSDWISANYSDATDGVLASDREPFIVKYANQYNEIDSSHPLFEIFQNTTTTAGVEDSIFESFCLNGETEQSSIKLNDLTYGFVDCDQAENNSTTNDGSQSVFCYGRGGTKSFPATNFVLNDFYLYIKYNNEYAIRKNDIGGEFLSEISKDSIDVSNTKSLLQIIERKHFDLLGLFTDNRYNNFVRSLRSATAIPFYNELQTYYLPNLSITIKKTDVETQDPSLGELWLGKKFVFINLVKVNAQAPNKVYNYTDQTYTDLIDIAGDGAVAVFEVILDGANYLWQKQTVDIPKVKNVYASLKNTKGVSSSSSSNVTDGREIVYLSNFHTFNVSIESFVDYKLNDFYLYNSCSYPLTVLFNGASNTLLANSSFVKVNYDGSFNPKELINNARTNFVETSLRNIDLSTQNADESVLLLQEVNSLFPSPQNDVYAKVNYSVKGETGYSDPLSALFRVENGKWSRVALQDYLVEDYCDLNISKLETYGQDFKLFIYGSSVRNQFSQSFDTYKLRLTEPYGRSTSFFIFNNTVNDLTIALPDMENYPVRLGKNRIAQIYKDSNKKTFFKVLEIHQRGRFYLSNKSADTNYINRNEIELFIDSLVPFDLETATPEIANDQIDCLLTLLPTSSKYTRAFYNSYGETVSDLRKSDTKGNYIENFSVIPFDNSQDLGWLYDTKSTLQKELIKPFLNISLAGHYILTNADYSIKITPNASDIFLVNNTSKDIRALEGESNYRLYRNTVCVVNTTSKRYLKKAKRKDAFYSVFNPKTLINTQRETSLILGIQRHQEILPIYDIDFIDVPSYLKLYSRYGQTQSVYLDFENYFLGKDIPSDCPENMVAYEVGTGHETISKFLFFDPSTNYYTLPGITAGVEYLVDFDEALFLNLQINKTDQEKFGSVKYMGKIYNNGETFIGGASFWYEIDCPDYIRVQKITREIPLGFEDFYEAETDSDINDDDLVNLDQNLQIPDDPLASLKSNIFANIGPTLAVFPEEKSSLCWIPESQNAFWLDSNFVKDVWEVQEIFSSDSKKISYNGQEVSFVKCKFKKIGSRFLIDSFFFNFYSALQDKLKMSDTKEISMGFDYNLTPNQKKKLNDIGQAVYNQQDYIYSDKEFLLAHLEQDYLIPNTSSTASVIKNADIEVSITIEKLKSMPELRIEDYSFDPTVTLLNNKA